MRERFDCRVLCSQKGEFLDEPRSAHGCTRIDLPPVPWHVEAARIHRQGWMGRAPISSSAAAAQASTISAAAKVHPDFPTEDASDGCPGGWYRSRFIDSLMPYLRRRDQHGGRVPNMILDRSDDDLIFELVQYAEDQEERYQMHREEVMNG